MASSVYFKFKSQREPTRVPFDGTGISVFELKREVVIKSGLGDGTDFDLAIYNEDGGEEYDDDTAVIPRSTTVIARRLPAAKPGAGRAARYIVGKMPVGVKNFARKEQAAKLAASASLSNAISQMNNALTEDDRIAAMFQAQSEQMSVNSGEISQGNYRQSTYTKKPVHIPDHDPPNGYVCYRCGEKGHWIQRCPTNDNAEFDNRPRLKRTTGIPRSFLKTVDKSIALAQGTGEEDVKRPSGIMMNSDGQFVIAEPDKASWEQFQAKTKLSSAAPEVASEDDREMQELGLVCPLDKKMFIEPMKTPCCQKTFCNECITNALIESDLVCPACQKEGVLLDDLQADDGMAEIIKLYLQEKDSCKVKSLATTPPLTQSLSETSPTPAKSDSTTSSRTHTTKPDLHRAEDAKLAPGKKRPADDPPEEDNTFKVSKTMPNTNAQLPMTSSLDAVNGARVFPGMMDMMMPNMMQFGNSMNMLGGFPVDMAVPMMGSPQMGMPGNSPQMGIHLNGMMYTANPMMHAANPMMHAGNPMMAIVNPSINPMNPMMNTVTPMMGMNGFDSMAGRYPLACGGPMMNGGYGDINGGGGMMNGMMNGEPGHHMSMLPIMSHMNSAGDDDAYFRKPVNPHRHQNRQRRIRPSDYTEL